MSGNESVLRHKSVTEELNALYERKNHDYGDSFHLTWEKFGAVMAAIRLEDKLQRFETLIRAESKVHDESIRDTLMDLANYSIMSVMELDREAEARRTVIEDLGRNLDEKSEPEEEQVRSCATCKYSKDAYGPEGYPLGQVFWCRKDGHPEMVNHDDTCKDFKSYRE